MLLIFSQVCSANLILYGTFQLSDDFPDLITNGDFTDWTGTPPDDAPDDWDLFNWDDGNVITEDSGKCSMVRADATPSLLQDLDVNEEDNVNIKLNMTTVTIGGLNIGSHGVTAFTYTTAGVKNFTYDVGTPQRISMAPTPDPTDLVIDDVQVRLASPWVFEEGWDLWTDGVASLLIITDTDNGLLYQDFGDVENRLYAVTFTIANWSFAAGTTLRCRVGGGEASRVSADGTYTLYLTAGDGSASRGVEWFILPTTAGDSLDLSNVNVEQVTPGSSTDEIIVSGNILICDPEKAGPTGRFRKTLNLVSGINTWESTFQLEDCEVETVTWVIWYDGTDWVISDEESVEGDSFWTATTAQDNPSNLTFSPQGNASGDAISFNAPDEAEGRRGRYEGVYRSRL